MAISVSAEAVGPLPEGFNDIDLSDILITFPAGAGAGIKNQTVLNDLYNNYGVSGWGVGDMTPYFDIVVASTGESAGLSNDVLNEHLGDNDWFQQNGYDLKVNYTSFKQKLDNTESLTQYGANYIHQATLSPSTGNPWEWDWSSILEEYFKTGLLAFEHTFISFDTLDAISVTMDEVMRNVYDFWTPNIASGVAINYDLSNINSLGFGSGFGFFTSGGYSYQVAYDPQKIVVGFVRQSNGFPNLAVGNISGERVWFGCKYFYNSSIPASYLDNIGPLNSGQVYFSGSVGRGPDITNLTEYTYQSFQDYVTGIVNGTVEKESTYSPDLINPSANISIEDFPQMSPSIEQGQAIRPIPQEAYQNWAQTNNLNDPAENGALMGALVTPYIEAEPAPAPSPAPDDPWADPVPDTEPATRPVSPTQPDFPDEPELTDEEINESLLGATPDLTEIFPFCIPWDISRILKHFTASRKAPYIEWTFESDLFGFSYTFELDMAIFDDVATILRLLELAGFILGLAILTRYLIGAN